MTQTLYVIAKKKPDGSMQGETLKVAAEKQGYNFAFIDEKRIDFFDLPPLQAGDMLFRVATGRRAAMIEQLLLCEGVGHIYKRMPFAFQRSALSYFGNLQAGLPVIKTIPLIPENLRDLDKYVSYLGGFPLIVKIEGDSHGIGVMKVDSIEALRSLLDYIKSLDVDVFLRSFVEHKRYARLVVVGDKVAGAHCKYVMKNEFRTNASGNEADNIVGNEHLFEPTAEMTEDAIKAVHSVGSAFGGVDFLLQDDGTYQIAEVNVPCNFAGTDKISGTDISGELVSYLTKKALS